MHEPPCRAASTQRDAGAGDGQGAVQYMLKRKDKRIKFDKAFKLRKHKADMFMSGKPRPAPLPKHSAWPSRSSTRT